MFICLALSHLLSNVLACILAELHFVFMQESLLMLRGKLKTPLKMQDGWQWNNETNIIMPCFFLVATSLLRFPLFNSDSGKIFCFCLCQESSLIVCKVIKHCINKYWYCMYQALYKQGRWQNTSASASSILYQKRTHKWLAIFLLLWVLAQIRSSQRNGQGHFLPNVDFQGKIHS